eukprot:scaffold167666_cov38-Prasinocladus_malaysianus.AAC.1
MFFRGLSSLLRESSGSCCAAAGVPPMSPRALRKDTRDFRDFSSQHRRALTPTPGRLRLAASASWTGRTRPAGA